MKIILGLAGEMASGKGTVSKYITKKYKGISYRFSDPLRDIFERMHVENNRDNLHRISKALRHYFGQDIFSKIIFEDIKREKKKVIVLDGARRHSDIKLLRNMDGFRLIFINADIKKRFGRLTARKEKSDDQAKKFKSFKEEHESEVEIKIRQLKKTADYVVDNNGSLSHLYHQIDQIMAEIARRKRRKR